MNKVRLYSNAKTIEGTPIPYTFFENAVIIVEKKQRTIVIRCKSYELEVYPEAIKEYL